MKTQMSLAAPEALTPDEIDGGRRLRAQLAAVGLDSSHLPPSYLTDFTLARWYRAHKGDAAEVERRMRELLAHREVFGYAGKTVEELDAMEGVEFSRRTFEKFAVANLRLDCFSDDLVVWAQRMADVDLNAILRSIPLSDILHSYFLLQERFHHAMSEHERKTGRQSAVVVIIDLRGMAISDFLNPLSAPSRMAKLVVKIWSDYFSENVSGWAVK